MSFDLAILLYKLSPFFPNCFHYIIITTTLHHHYIIDEYTRVQLHKIEGVEGSDYINANYIQVLNL